jgi:cytochrome d ubiquinol oxidase subunit I
MTAAAFVVGVSFWLMRRGPREEDRGMYRSAVRSGAAVLLVAGLGVAISGDVQGKIMTDVQPMKMAAAEALYETEEPAAFSILTIGTLDGSEEVFAIKIPRLLSFLATGTVDGEVLGIDDLRAEYIETYGQDPGATYYSPGDYTPPIALAYWTFRLMMGLGILAAAVGVWILWATRRGREPQGRLIMWAALTLPLMPLLANSFGWIFTEVGRQPWVVFGLMTTARGVSPGTSSAEVLTSLIVLTLLYGALAVIEVKLLLTYIRKGADPLPEPSDDASDDPDRPLAFAY